MNASVALESTDKYRVPLKKGVHRVKVFKGLYEFEYINRKRTKVTYTAFSDPGGKLTPLITYQAQKKIPYNTLKGLGKIADDEKYYKLAMKNYN